eukprot:Phypoly_transcript_11326.p1 GENE.Phypoly_transcript_11326~~Phypoly_transcript_11326.p1  ORF type:complete len:359 (+),score=24.79 Phypoly_transcript_11326:91-1167(+)
MGRFLEDHRIQIAFLTAGGFALTLGLYQGVIIHHTAPGTRALKIAYTFESIWEAAVFGFGLGFFIVYGYAISKVDSGPVRSRCIGIWLAISYFFMSWWPHAMVHQFLTPINPKNFIILEMCFHWPNLAAALVLCYYQLDVLLISYSVAHNKKELRGWSEADTQPVLWYKNIKYHGAVIAAMGIAGWITLGWAENPYPPFIPRWEKVLYWSIYVCDGSAGGIAMGFVYSAARVAHRLPKKRTRTIAAISIFAIALLLIIATPHSIAHFHAATNPNHVIIVEYTFHLTITGITSILAYFQHKFLVLALEGRMTLMMKFKDTKVDDNMTSETELRGMSSTKNSSGSGIGVSVQMTEDSECD